MLIVFDGGAVLVGDLGHERTDEARVAGVRLRVSVWEEIVPQYL
jgi:hypothetical protein